MMGAIWKFPLPLNRQPGWVIEMPRHAHVLTVQMQNGTPMLWALVDPAQPKQIRTFALVGTGWEFDAVGMRYLATVQDEVFVWHLFERYAAAQS